MQKKKKLKNKKVSKLDVPIHKIKVSRSITADFLDEELKDIENLNIQIKYLELLKKYCEEKLIIKKKELLVNNISFLKKTINEKMNEELTNEQIIKGLSKKWLVNQYYSMLICSKYSHLFTNTPVTAIDKELRLIEIYLSINISFKEYSQSKKKDLEKYLFNYDKRYTDLFYKLLKSEEEKLDYATYLKYEEKNINDARINIQGRKKDAIRNDKIEKISVIISKKIFLKGFRLFVIPPKELNIPSYIECESKDEIIIELVANHFYFVNEDDKIDKFAINNEKINWITEYQIPLYLFLNACEDFKIFSDEQKNRKDVLYSQHFSYKKNNLKPVNIGSRKSRLPYSIKDKKIAIKDILVRSVINIFLERLQ